MLLNYLRSGKTKTPSNLKTVWKIVLQDAASKMSPNPSSATKWAFKNFKGLANWEGQQRREFNKRPLYSKLTKKKCMVKVWTQISST